MSLCAGLCRAVWKAAHGRINASRRNGASFSAGTSFVKVDFTPKCSANVFLDGEETSATVFRVGAASSKGKSRFPGTTAGGSVGNVGACAANPCTQTGDSQVAMAAASS
ncbi:hypothetical protein ACCAA_990007 [Candidatus Accumulibacter aalborgensis]|uniref:Uncharacterized protein n=1 Tax=Candidatus Accumulibacter aalborgensis TaxID=1860102 RepID=A0A1A8Y036_9PROT|nr:hypothetical protein ACCAA_990007 [Candidatus Accumulibacter aalborgensis]